MIAVTKYAELSWVQALYDLGVRDFGESRPQQLAQRARELPADVRWHLIGHLQRNKVSLVLPPTHLLHSVDSLRLAKEISREAERTGATPSLLLEVNVSGEASKDGFAPDDLIAQWPLLAELPHLSWNGLMTMAPLDRNAEQARPVFAALRRLREQLGKPSHSHPLKDLSMGMSGDFEVGIEEGATFIRVGSLLFEGLASEPAAHRQQPHAP